MIKRRKTKKKAKKKTKKARVKKKKPVKKSGIKGLLTEKISKKKYIAPILAGLIIILAVFALNPAGNKCSVIMVVDNKACRCVKKRCAALDTQATELAESKFKNKVEITKLQYRDKSTKSVMDKYNMGMVPSVVLLDSEGEVKGSWHYYNFSIEKFEGAIKSVINGG